MSHATDPEILGRAWLVIGLTAAMMVGEIAAGLPCCRTSRSRSHPRRHEQKVA